MPGKATALVPQKASRKNSEALIRLPGRMPDTISWWVEQYFRFEVTTSASSQKLQRRDLALFISYMLDEEGRDDRVAWSPRLSKAFQSFLKKETVEGERRWSDRTVNRIMAHLTTLSKSIHKLRPFPWGHPTETP